MKTIRKTKDSRLRKRRCNAFKRLMLQAGLSSHSIMKKIGSSAQKASIYSLPNELIVEILARVAASSISNFLRAKLSSKLFNKLAQDNYIYGQLSLDQLSYNLLDFYLSKDAISLFTRCLESQNPEALYREGVREYVSFHKAKESGLELLERASSAGHLGASYALGIILICKGDEFTQRGLKLIGNIKTSLQMRECREKLKRLAVSTWFTPNEDFLKPKLFQCPFQDRKRSSWPLSDCDDNDSDLQHCETCRLNREILHTCSMLSGVVCCPYQMCSKD